MIEKIINGFYTHSKEAREALLSFLPAAEEEKMEVSNSMFKSSTDQVIVFPNLVSSHGEIVKFFWDFGQKFKANF